MHFPNGKLMSAAFHNSRFEDKMSVDIASRTTVDRSLRKFKRKRFGLVSFSVGLAKKLNQRVSHEPVPLNHAHGSVIGRKNTRVARQFKQNARWERLPSAAE